MELGLEDKERQRLLLDLFVHPGWKLFVSQMQEAHEMLIETAYTVADEKQLYKRKGEIQKLAELLSFEAITKMQVEPREWEVDRDD